MFLGHVGDVAVNFNKPLLQFQKKKTLFNNNGSYKLASNVCPHQGSLISSVPSNKFICQYHGWSWNNNGKAVNAGSTSLCNNSNLYIKDTYSINSLLFDKQLDLTAISSVDLSHMILIEQRIDTVNSEFGNIVDVFLDVDHIPIVHNGIYDAIGIGGAADVNWKYYDWGNIQLVNKNIHVSDEFQKTLLNIEEERVSAFWLTVFPYTMIEWQPGAMFITVCVPKKDTTDVVVLKYKDTRYNETNWKINSELWETAWSQDKHQAESIVARCVSSIHLEQSKLEFRKWVETHGLA